MMFSTKMWMKRTCALLVCLAPIGAMPALSQSDAPSTAPQSDAPPPPAPGGRHGGPEHRVEMLQRELNLSADQTTQVKALLATERTKMEALRADTALSGEDRHTQMMAIHKDGEIQLRGLLTPEQVTKYEAMLARMHDRMAQHENGQAPPPPPPPGAPQA